MPELLLKNQIVILEEAVVFFTPRDLKDIKSLNAVTPHSLHLDNKLQGTNSSLAQKVGSDIF